MIGVLAEIKTYEELKSQVKDPQLASLPNHLTQEHHGFSSRLLKYPMQCLLLVESILWSHRMREVLCNDGIKDQVTEFGKIR